MPTNNGIDRQRIQKFRTNEYQSVDSAAGEFPWSRPPQNVYLLSQRQNFCIERYPRPKQIDNHPNNQPEYIPHCTTASPDFRSFASQMRFPTRTDIRRATLFYLFNLKGALRAPMQERRLSPAGTTRKNRSASRRRRQPHYATRQSSGRHFS
jgi:hypothetical protein